MSISWRTKHRNSREGLIDSYRLRISSTLYPVFRRSVSPCTSAVSLALASVCGTKSEHPSYARSGSSACDKKSDDFRRRYTSCADAQYRGPWGVWGRRNAASYVGYLVSCTSIRRPRALTQPTGVPGGG